MVVEYAGLDKDQDDRGISEFDVLANLTGGISMKETG